MYHTSSAAAENLQFVERNIDLRADALVLQEGVSELSQSAPVEIMPVVQKLEGDRGSYGHFGLDGRKHGGGEVICLTLNT